MSTDVTAEWAATNLAWCEEHRQWLFYCPIQIGDRDVFHKCMEAHDSKLREQIKQDVLEITVAGYGEHVLIDDVIDVITRSIND